MRNEEGPRISFLVLLSSMIFLQHKWSLEALSNSPGVLRLLAESEQMGRGSGGRLCTWIRETVTMPRPPDSSDGHGEVISAVSRSTEFTRYREKEKQEYAGTIDSAWS